MYRSGYLLILDQLPKFRAGSIPDHIFLNCSSLGKDCVVLVQQKLEMNFN